MGTWTIGRKLGLGFGAVALLTAIVGTVAIVSLRATVASKDAVIDDGTARLIGAEELRGNLDRRVGLMRGYLLTGSDDMLAELKEARTKEAEILENLRARDYSPEGRAALKRVVDAIGPYVERVDAAVTLRQGGEKGESVEASFARDVLPRGRELRDSLDAFVAGQSKDLAEASRRASDVAATSSLALGLLAGFAALLTIALAALLTRGLTRQLGSAIEHIRSSSAELQAAANQQASTSREQASATVEITTTITELLATARQIAESAQRVARIAQDTSGAASGGDAIVQAAREAVGSVKRQVEVVVGHMLELGKKSQQIGGILELVSEFAEQTNILSINAAIEAAGAGEAGARFGVVADEIRKLADRVGESTKEIRSLIEEIRASANTTVMATEDGLKASERGTRQFGDVAASFSRIAALVSTTAEAAREIELSTKQQSTAVEQVNLAIANVAQAAQETEVSSRQTLATSSELATLSLSLTRVIRPGVS